MDEDRGPQGAAPIVVPVGDNKVLLWGLDTAERLRRIAGAQALEVGRNPSGPALLVDLDYVFDPAWLRVMTARPGEMLTLGGRPIIAHCRDAREAEQVRAAMEQGAALPGGSKLRALAYEQADAMINDELRKREQPFLMRLDDGSVRAAERASYFGAYKGVTDLLTKYLWPEWALVLTRIAARLGISPNAVTTVAAIFCVAATFFFWHGWFWTGMAVGLVFMVLDTVDGKLARCTITSSAWGNIFDHGIDLVHPPFWWYAWGVGLAAYGRPVEPDVFWLVMVAIVGGYVVQRIIEGAFILLFGMHIHVWRKLDSDFRLITARRNPNMVILFVATAATRPDIGFLAIGVWTILSCLFHLARLVQAIAIKAGGGEIRSWLG